jgi:hypothetical protein
VNEPQFSPDSIWVSVTLSNLGRKAIGFGAQGFGLVLVTGQQRNTTPLRYLLLGSNPNKYNFAFGTDPDVGM